MDMSPTQKFTIAKEVIAKMFHERPNQWTRIPVRFNVDLSFLKEVCKALRLEAEWDDSGLGNQILLRIPERKPKLPEETEEEYDSESISDSESGDEWN
jgi:hypothetical protein